MINRSYPSNPTERFPISKTKRSKLMNRSGKNYRVAVLRGMYAVLCLALLLFGVGGQARAQSILTHHVREVIHTGEAKSVGHLPSDEIMNLNIVLRLRDQAGLDSFLKELYDPASPSYRHFLTVAEFTEKFGPTQAEYDAVVRFAKANGLEVTGGSRDGMTVQIRGSVSAVENAFHVSMGTYQHPT